MIVDVAGEARLGSSAEPRRDDIENDRKARPSTLCNPSGIEAGRNITGARGRTGASTETAAGRWPAAAAECNECNEPLDGVRNALTLARRLAVVAENAIVNGDVHRARAALRQIHGPQKSMKMSAIATPVRCKLT